MKLIVLSILLFCGVLAMASSEAEEFGQFSVSLGVKSMPESLKFYKQLGFSTLMGDPEKGWLILKKGDVVIGLFNHFKTGPGFLTFNPKDVRAVQKDLKRKGFKFATEADETTTGPASAVLMDPDQNTILFDQH
jgi:catechol 2,3-dioxygenase-like lactoylglutathione lyase family enzyme